MGWRRKTGKKKIGEARRALNTRKGRKVVRGSGLSKEKKTKEGKEREWRLRNQKREETTEKIARQRARRRKKKGYGAEAKEEKPREEQERKEKRGWLSEQERRD